MNQLSSGRVRWYHLLGSVVATLVVSKVLFTSDTRVALLEFFRADGKPWFRIGALQNGVRVQNEPAPAPQPIIVQMPAPPAPPPAPPTIIYITAPTPTPMPMPPSPDGRRTRAKRDERPSYNIFQLGSNNQVSVGSAGSAPLSSLAPSAQGKAAPSLGSLLAKIAPSQRQPHTVHDNSVRSLNGHCLRRSRHAIDASRCDGLPPERFGFTALPTAGTYLIESRADPTTPFCIVAAKAATVPSIAPCKLDDASQHWLFRDGALATADGRCLTLVGPDRDVQLESCQHRPEQLLHFI